MLAMIASSPARADWLLTPYIGGVFGGASNQFTFNDADDEFEQRMNYGVSFGYYTNGEPFSVAFVGDQFTDAALLSYTFDFESAIAGTAFARIAPTLTTVPEPAMSVMVLCGVALVIRPRSRSSYRCDQQWKCDIVSRRKISFPNRISDVNQT